MREYILGESNWKQIRDQEIDLAVLPWGATEAHNYHLPYSSDNIESDSIAAEAGRIAWEKGAKILYYRQFHTELIQVSRMLNSILILIQAHRLL